MYKRQSHVCLKLLAPVHLVRRIALEVSGGEEENNKVEEKTTRLSEEDVELLWKALINMFENDHSAARGKMCMRKLYVFKHDCMLGNCPSHVLFDKIKVEQISEEPPRSFGDYSIEVDNQMPEGVELIEKI